MKRYLLIDDLRPVSVVKDNGKSAFITVARTYADAINALADQPPFDEIYLDHDLGCFGADGREYTGYDVICWLEQNPDKIPKKFTLVTSNPVGRQRMQQVIDRMQGR